MAQTVASTEFRFWTTIIHEHVVKSYAELIQEIQQKNTRFRFLAEDKDGNIICEEADFSQSDYQLIQVKLKNGKRYSLDPYCMEHGLSMETVSQWYLDDGDFMCAPDSDKSYTGDINLRGFLRNGSYLTGPIRVKFVTSVAPGVSMVVTSKGIWLASIPMTYEMYLARYEKQFSYNCYTYNGRFAGAYAI